MHPGISRRHALPLLASVPLWAGRSAYAAPLASDIPGTPSSDLYAHATLYLRELIRQQQFAGAILMVSRRGQPDFIDITGWMDGGRKIPMPRGAIFGLASLSKPITGVATAILLEQGKVRLDDPVEKWMPELANRRVLRKPDGPLEDTYPSPRPIQVGDLLAFRCGYGGDGPRGPFDAAMRTANTSPIPSLTLSGTDFLNELNPIPLQFPPGTQWQYDTPADLLGVLIERVSGQRYSEYLAQYVFGPLGMKDTGFFIPPDKAFLAAQNPNGKPGGALQQPRFESGAHGMVSTADDYMLFTRMLLNKGELNGVRILKPSSVDAIKTDRLTPPERISGDFVDRYPGRGFGWCGAVRTVAMLIGPSIGSYNWAGATGVWMMTDFAREIAIVIMVQHPGGGPPQPGGASPIPVPGAPGSDAPPGVKYLPQLVWNDLMQTELYKDVL